MKLWVKGNVKGNANNNGLQCPDGLCCFQEESVGGDAASSAELGIDNVGGVFVVLGSGCGAAFLIAVIEFLWNVKEVAVDEKVIIVEVSKKTSLKCEKCLSPSVPSSYHYFYMVMIRLAAVLRFKKNIFGHS